MTDKLPNIAARTPAVLTLEAGSYWWCSCGLSANQPHCDGAHKTAATEGEPMKPVQFELQEAKQVALCNCKQTTKPPYCDGTHSKL